MNPLCMNLERCTRICWTSSSAIHCLITESILDGASQQFVYCCSTAHESLTDDMSALLFKLRNVPDDEADDIRALLDEQNIDIYETTAGNWGISMPAMWVQHDEDLAAGKSLIKAYQVQRAATSRAAYNEKKRLGQTPSIWQSFAKRPLASLGIILFCVFVLYVMISPFVKLAFQS